MNDVLLGFGLNGLIFSFALAALAAAVQATGKRPMLSHLLWILVLVKLLTPALIAVPGIALPTLSLLESDGSAHSAAALDGGAVALDGVRAFDTTVDSRFDATLTPTGLELAATAPFWPTVLAWIWLTGSALVLLGSMLRIVRFQLALSRAAIPAPPAIQEFAEELAASFSIRRMPLVLIARAQVPPLVWWMGGAPPARPSCCALP